MSGLLTEETGPPPPPEQRPGPLYVDGVRHVHSAATFWPGLLDEIFEKFPGTTDIELWALSEMPLEPDLLRPEQALQRDMNTLDPARAAERLAQTVTELELTGPPSLVSIRLTSGGESLLERALPAHALDAETFPFLLCWLLQWAAVPPFLWNNERVHGAFTGEDPKRNRAYVLSFDVENRHVEEGLYRRAVRLTAQVQDDLLRQKPTTQRKPPS